MKILIKQSQSVEPFTQEDGQINNLVMIRAFREVFDWACIHLERNDIPVPDRIKVETRVQLLDGDVQIVMEWDDDNPEVVRI